MPSPLRKAHDVLDALVDKTYGLTRPTDAKRAEALVAKHHEIVDRQRLVVTEPKVRKLRR